MLLTLLGEGEQCGLWAAHTVVMSKVQAGWPALTAGWCTVAWSLHRSCPRTQSPTSDHLDSEQQQSIWEEEQLFFWIKFPPTFRRSYWHPWSVLLLDPMLMSVIHVDVPGLCSPLKPRWCPWSVLRPETMLRSMIPASPGNNEEVYHSFLLAAVGKEASFVVV